MGFDVVASFRINAAAERQVLLLSRKTVERVADAVVGTAKTLVPVDTGALRESIHKEVEADSVIVATGTGYGGFVEVGTSKQRAQPFMGPALQRVAAEIRGGNL